MVQDSKQEEMHIPVDIPKRLSSVVSSIAQELQEEWEIPQDKNLPASPTVLLIGGFQGSGKSTLIDELTRTMPMIVLSSDRTRHELFKHVELSDDFILSVRGIMERLIVAALKTGAHIAIDANLTPERLKKLTQFIRTTEKDHNMQKHSIVTVFLTAPLDVLKKRVTERSPAENAYTGTVNELEAHYIDREKLNLDLYDKIFDTDSMNIKEIAQKLRNEI